MTIAKKITQIISDFPDDFVFAVRDLDCDMSQRDAAARALQRMAERGDVSKLANGKYYKPRQTQFGELEPSPAQIVKDFLVRDGRIIGYLTGAIAFSQYSLTTQISSEIQIGTNYYRRSLKRGSYKISFVFQPNEIREESIDMLRLLDCLKFIKIIPGATADEACKQIIRIIEKLGDNEKIVISENAIKYPPFVRALLGAILEYVEFSAKYVNVLRQSLTGVSKYRLPIADTTLPNKLKWRIYEPARK